MSVVVLDRSIIPSVWPAGLGRVDSRRFNAQVKDGDWRYVPQSFEDICDWATVTTEEDDVSARGRRYLVYSPSVLPADKQGSMFNVQIVLQGVLGDFNLSPLGNWNRKESGAPSATRYLFLESGGFQPAFDAQRRALENLRELVTVKLGSGIVDEEDNSGRIEIRRSLFTKVRPTGDQLPAVRMGDATDPGGYARKIASRWRVDHNVRIGVRRADGRNMDIAPSALQRGDFVEVTVFADVHLVRRNKRTGPVIRFAMNDVIRLWRGKDVQQMLPNTASGASVSHPRVLVMPSTLHVDTAVEDSAMAVA
ncbi:hypothetical protein OH77DRAFT_1525556 [Trametes cingulata]|nr:hypothetical protein OH77DRAFT_1525556 [Trametes cingulata]